MPAVCNYDWIGQSPAQWEEYRRKHAAEMRKLFRSPQRRDRRLLAMIRREERDKKRAER